MPTTTRERSAVEIKADEIYKNVIRPQLTQSDKGKYLYIHTGNGEWMTDEDEMAIWPKAKERWGTGQPLWFMRIGYKAPTAFRAGLDLELPEW